MLEIPEGGKTQSILLNKIIVKVERGTKIGVIQSGEYCGRDLIHGDLQWKEGKIALSDEDFTAIVHDELEKANIKAVGDSNALFEDQSQLQAGLLLGGIIKEIQANICYPWAPYGNFTTSKGKGYIRVEWDVYSTAERKVVYTVTTEGSSIIDIASTTGANDVFLDAFQAATHNLLADKGFHVLVMKGENNR
jgi:hypothetical protein